MSKVESFAPSIDDRSRILILGSMPGVKSIKEQQYYANPRNHFWKIIYSIFSTPLDQEYNDRIFFIREKGIALWDVISTCYRVGSLDSNIENETVNDFRGLIDNYPNLKLVVFNGTKAFEVYKKRVGFDQPSIDYKLLPSTSPANTMKFEAKLKEWGTIVDYLTI
ncbi:DNA-deoxyinosine glycosylase [Desulfitobacterium sp. THU1]|uniref:DNA-deoxyinosine glycosylase n=1 Tax=Desulfitobacterium sp. THU1 TaxID=3138072 RepID=UPI00311F378B